MYHGEIPSDHYLNHMLDPFDRANVNYIHFSLHRYLLQRNVSSALIAVGSTVTGVASTEGFVGSASPQDLDLKVIACQLRQSERFRTTISEWRFNLSKKKFPLPTRSPFSVRYTYQDRTREDYAEFGYDGGIILTPSLGKTIDLIVKNPHGLRARDHITKEQELGNSFSVLYLD